MHFKKRMDSEWLHPHLQNLAFLATNSGMRTAFLVLSRADIIFMEATFTDLAPPALLVLVYCTPS